jgi:nucleoside-diphosphate-sugar epimerase
MGRMEIKNVVVTGSEGYIGSVLVPLLVQKGYTVTGIDACFYGISGNDGYTLLRKDIRHVTPKDLGGADAIIHLAALSNDVMGELDSRLTDDINYIAAVNLAETAKKAGVKRFLFSSSCSVYGKPESGTVNEQSPVAPLTQYAKSKVAGEQALLQLADANFTVGILRNATVYGYSPKFRSDLVVNNFVTTAVTANEIRVKSDGTPWRPLIDVRDLSRAFMGFLTLPATVLNTRVINVGFTENNLQVKDILSVVAEVFDGCRVIYTGEHAKDSRSYRVDFSLFHSLLPHITQQWPLVKSIRDMKKQLSHQQGDAMLRESKTYVRITALQELWKNNKMNQALFPVKAPSRV